MGKEDGKWQVIVWIESRIDCEACQEWYGGSTVGDTGITQKVTCKSKVSAEAGGFLAGCGWGARGAGGEKEEEEGLRRCCSEIEAAETEGEDCCRCCRGACEEATGAGALRVWMCAGSGGGACRWCGCAQWRSA